MRVRAVGKTVSSYITVRNDDTVTKKYSTNVKTFCDLKMEEES